MSDELTLASCQRPSDLYDLIYRTGSVTNPNFYNVFNFENHLLSLDELHNQYSMIDCTDRSEYFNLFASCLSNIFSCNEKVFENDTMRSSLVCPFNYSYERHSMIKLACCLRNMQTLRHGLLISEVHVTDCGTSYPTDDFLDEVILSIDEWRFSELDGCFYIEQFVYEGTVLIHSWELEFEYSDQFYDIHVAHTVGEYWHHNVTVECGQTMLVLNFPVTKVEVWEPEIPFGPDLRTCDCSYRQKIITNLCIEYLGGDPVKEEDSCPTCDLNLSTLYAILRKNIRERGPRFFSSSRPSVGAMGLSQEHLCDWRRLFDKTSHKDLRRVVIREVTPAVTRERQLHGLLDKIGSVKVDLSENAQKTIDNLMSFVDTRVPEFTSDNVNSVMKECSDYLIRLSKHVLKEVALFIGILAICYMAYSKGWSVVAMLGAFAYVLYIFQVEVTKYLAWFVGKIFPESDFASTLGFVHLLTLENQNFDDSFFQKTVPEPLRNRKLQADIPFLEIGMTCAFGAASLACLKFLPTDKETNDFLKKCNLFPRALKGFADLIGIFSKSYKWFEEFVRVQILKQAPIMELDGGIQEVTAWLEECQACFNPEFYKNIKTHKENAEKAVSCYFKGARLEQQKHRFSREATDKLVMGLRGAWKLYEEGIGSTAFSQTSRSKPVCLMLRGGTSVGKTALVEFLAMEVLVSSLGVSPDDIEANGLSAYMYSRNTGQEFWDGYNRQPIVLYDDFGQLKDSPGAPNPEWLELIHGVNGFQFNLHMAELAAKSNTALAAKMFILTSNLKSLNCPSLYDHNAVASRLTDIYRVEIKPEFQKLGSDGQSRLDVAKALEGCDDPINFEVYQFVRQQVDSRGYFVDVTGDTITYDTLKTLMRFKANVQEKEFTDLTDFKKTYLQRLRALHGGVYDAVAGTFSWFTRPTKVHWNASNPDDVELEEELKFEDAYDDYGCFDMALDGARHQLNRLRQAVDTHPWAKTCLALASALALIGGIYLIWNSFNKKPQESLRQDVEIVFDIEALLSNEQECENMIENVAELQRSNLWDDHFQLDLGVYANTKAEAIEKCKKWSNIKLLTTDSVNPGFYPMLASDIQLARGMKRLETDEVTIQFHDGSHHTNQRQERRRFQNESPGKNIRMRRRNLQSGFLTPTQIWHVLKHVSENARYACQFFLDGVEIFYERENGEELVFQNAKTEYICARPRDLHGQECEDVSVKCKRNMAVVCLEEADGSRAMGCGLFLGGTVMMIPYHFVATARQFIGAKIFIQQFGSTFRQYIPSEAFYNGFRIGRDKDAYAFDTKLEAQRRKMTGLFIERKDYDLIQGTRVRLVTRVRDSLGQEPECVMKEGKASIVTNTKITVPIEGTKEVLNFLSIIESTDIVTTPGQCGGPLVIDNNMIRGKICGTLSIGDAVTFSEYTPLCREEVEEAMNHFEKTHGGIVMGLPETVTEQEVSLPIDGKFLVEGTTDIYHEANKTSWVQTEIAGLIAPIEDAPARLYRSKDDNDPKFLGLAKCAQPRIPIDEMVVEAVRQDVQNAIFAQSVSPQEKHRRVFTYEESVRGIEGELYLDAVNRRSSPGHPWNNLKPKGSVGKSYFLGDNDDFKFGTPENELVRTSVNRLVSLAKDNIRAEAIFVDTLKDEIRPIDPETGKVKKTRVFAAGPMHFTLAARMYYLDFMAFLQHNRIRNGICVGTNPFSDDWDYLARVMQTHPHIVAGDFSNYDGSISNQMLTACVDIINNHYRDGEENQKIRRVIGSMISRSQHLLDGVVYQWDHSLPSGNPFTATLNSMINLMVVRIAWITETGKSLTSFNQNVKMVAYGDDNLMCISDDVIDIFNQEVITNGLAKIGMEYTDELKTGKVVKYRTLSEVEFLKRAFRWCESQQRYVAPLRIASILKMTNWQHKTADPTGALAMNISSCYRELSLHSEEVYRHWTTLLENVLTADIRRRMEVEPTYSMWQVYWRSEESATYTQWFHSEIPFMATLSNYDPIIDMETEIEEIETNCCPIEGLIIQQQEAALQTNVKRPRGKGLGRPTTRIHLRPATQSLTFKQRKLQGGVTTEEESYEITVEETYQPDLMATDPQLKHAKPKELKSDSGKAEVRKEGNQQGSGTMVKEPQQTTVFTDDSRTMAFDMLVNGPSQLKMSDMLNTAVRDYTFQEIRTFLETPIEIGAFSWTTSTAALSSFEVPVLPGGNNLTSTFLNQIDIPRVFFHNQMFYDKIKHMAEFRGTACFQFVMNCQPFQCGSLFITAEPYPTRLANRAASFESSNLMSWTSQPGIVWNIGAGKQQINVKLPSFGPDLFYDIGNDTVSWWNIVVACLTPLRDPAGTGKVEVSVYGWYEDVDIRFRTGYKPALEPSATTMYQLKTSHPQKNMRRRHLHMENVKIAQDNTVSGTCSSLAQTANLFSKIPVVGEYAQIAADTLSSVGGIASAMGYSKPMTDTAHQKAQLYQGSSFVTMNGEFVGHSIAAMEKNALEPAATGGSLDEMAIRHIIEQPCVGGLFTWADSAIPGTQLWSELMTPSIYAVNIGATPGNTEFTMIPLMAGLQPFQFWNGDLIFHFEAMKTQYHSGRLEITYVPGYYQTDLDTSVIDVNAGHRWIWNLKDTSTFDVVLPFVNSVQWKRNKSLFEIENSPYDDPASACGTLFVRVLNPLTLTNVVSPTIDIIVTILPDENFSWGGLQACEAIPYNAQSVAPSERQLHADFSLRSEKAGSAEVRLVSEIGHAGPPSSSNILSTIGEAVVSVRQIVKRFSKIHHSVFPGNTSTTYFQQNAMIVQPNTVVQATEYVDLASMDDVDSYDWLNYFQGMYVTRRGGTRIQQSWVCLISGINTPGAKENNVAYVRVLLENSLSEAEALTWDGYVHDVEIPGGNALKAQFSGELPVYISNEGFVSLEVPYYSPAHCLLNEFEAGINHPGGYNGSANYAYESYLIPANQFWITPYTMKPAYTGESTGYSYSVTTYRAGRDDFEFGTWWGVPPYSSYRPPIWLGRTPPLSFMDAKSGKTNSPSDRAPQSSEMSNSPLDRAPQQTSELKPGRLLTQATPASQGKPLFLINQWRDRHTHVEDVIGVDEIDAQVKEACD